MNAQVQIHPNTYRGKVGFTISGKDTHGRSVSIFTVTRKSAEHIRDKVKAGLDIELADFGHQTEVRCFADMERDGKLRYQVRCSLCGPVGVARDRRGWAEASAERHQEISGFEVAK